MRMNIAYNQNKIILHRCCIYCADKLLYSNLFLTTCDDKVVALKSVPINSEITYPRKKCAYDNP